MSLNETPSWLPNDAASQSELRATAASFGYCGVAAAPARQPDAGAAWLLQQDSIQRAVAVEREKAESAERQRKHERDMQADRHSHERSMLLIRQPSPPAQLSGDTTVSRFGVFEWLKHPLIMALVIAAVPFVFSRLFGSQAPVRHVTRRSGPRRPLRYARSARQNRFWRKRSRRVSCKVVA